MTPLKIVSNNASKHRLWRLAGELADLFAGWPWILVGAQMVMLLELEAGRGSGRATRDVDVIVDARAVAGAPRLAAERLLAAGFQPSPEYAHRFTRDRDQVDLLAPDRLGARADLTTIASRVTVSIPGGSRALSTRRIVSVDVDATGAFELPVPTIAGAIILKLRAYGARHEDRDLEDLVRLFGLVTDVEETRANLKPAERRALGLIGRLAQPDDSAWLAVKDRSDARSAFRRLTD
jgi:predicted nucleotidyltransferase